MYLSRRRNVQRGIYQATAFRFKPAGRTGLKAGGYFLTIAACEAFRGHFEHSSDSETSGSRVAGKKRQRPRSSSIVSAGSSSPKSRSVSSEDEGSPAASILADLAGIALSHARLPASKTHHNHKRKRVSNGSDDSFSPHDSPRLDLGSPYRSTLSPSTSPTNSTGSSPTQTAPASTPLFAQLFPKQLANPYNPHTPPLGEAQHFAQGAPNPSMMLASMFNYRMQQQQQQQHINPLMQQQLMQMALHYQMAAMQSGLQTQQMDSAAGYGASLASSILLQIPSVQTAQAAHP